MADEPATITQEESSMPPIPQVVDTEGLSWEAPSWRPLATAGGILGGTATALAGALAGRRRVAGALAALGGGAAVAGSTLGVASAVAHQFLQAPHTTPVTDAERAFMAENPDDPVTQALLRSEVIGRMIVGAPGDSWEGYYQVLEPGEVELLRRNRALEADACWEWRQGVTMREARIQAEDDVTLVAHTCTPNPGSKLWVVLVHGYHGCWNEMTQYAYRWAARGYNLLFPEMRGHGQSGGTLVGMGWLDRRDLVCWLRWLVGTRGEDIRVVLHGHSMGGATVCLASAEEDLPPQVGATVSDCAYSDALNVLAPILRDGFHVPTHPAMEVLRLAVKIRPDGYDLADAAPETAAPRVRVPVLVMHGERDTFVPPYMAQRIYQSLPKGRRALCTFPGAGHCQSVVSDPDRYWRHVDDFVRDAGGLA